MSHVEQQIVSRHELPDPSEWVDRFGDYLFRYALIRLRKRELAEDHVQETFLAALRSREQFSGKASCKTWLVSILKHKIIDTLRREHQQRPVSDLPDSDEFLDGAFTRKQGIWRIKLEKWHSDPGADLERQEFWAVFFECLAQLPSRLAEAFGMKELDKMESEEVRETLKLSAGNLSVLLHRARMRLWRCLDLHWFRKD